MNRYRTHLTAGLVVAIAVAGASFAACGDDDDGESQEAVADLSATYEDFRRDLQATANVEEASDDTKDSLKDDCGTLDDEVDSDALSEFCDDLAAAIDDENQSDYAAVIARFPSDVQAPFQDHVAEIVEDADDDQPLEGGDESNDDDDAVDDNGLDNPLDDDDGDGN